MLKVHKMHLKDDQNKLRVIEVEDYLEKRYRNESMIWGSEPSPQHTPSIYLGNIMLKPF